ncbi:1-acyl-sn-glycerol-3-phosphate acyltransferase [Mucilaginibacter sp. Bleaf8]|uniref:lysophospholipid acyltransferase family protein n=1 Tax=Mucilaginibacter sp. Bleaf8 TaxID=2834430 RepID=UPI001BCCEFE1|nr:lysophospholipid acyltransferase family protein [Mucilaginibacter sp. Bleaf8]MBS7566034.1 1-acyl-sn-glycerol-3-phosphate acyltransferase [Mucilaginibacter sp. Bleaf8]
MKKFFGYILSAIHYPAFGLLLVIFQPIQWICYRFFGYAAHKRSVDILNYFLTSTYYLLGNRVSFINRQSLPEGRPIIFIANHQSMYDIPPMIFHLRRYHAKFISKIELTKGIPSISYNLKVGGGANIDRKDPRQSIMELVKLGERMKSNNWSTVIFPEGTRSKDGHVRKFQSAGVATILKKCPNALLVPVAINNAWKMVRYGIYPLSSFEHLKFEILAPIEPNGQPVDAVVSQVEEEIRKKVSPLAP